MQPFSLTMDYDRSSKTASYWLFFIYYLFFKSAEVSWRLKTEKSFWINPNNHGYLSITHIYLNLKRALQSYSAHSISAGLLSLLSQCQCHSFSVLVINHRTMNIFSTNRLSILNSLLSPLEDTEMFFVKCKITLSVDFRANKMKLKVSLLLIDMEILKPLHHEKDINVNRRVSQFPKDPYHN